MAKKATRQAALARAKELGAIVTENGGSWYEFNVEAPAGFCWEEELHEQINAMDKGQKPNEKFWRHVIERMADGVRKCETADCEWCADSADETGGAQ